jgi:CP family cyanate transporter-like MFS transporter
LCRSGAARPVVITSILFIIGILGVWLGSTELMALWAICIGIGGGFAFGLAMGPALFGFLHDATDSWNTPLALLAAASILLFAAGREPDATDMWVTGSSRLNISGYNY